MEVFGPPECGQERDYMNGGRLVGKTECMRLTETGGEWLVIVDTMPGHSDTLENVKIYVATQKAQYILYGW